MGSCISFKTNNKIEPEKQNNIRNKRMDSIASAPIIQVIQPEETNHSDSIGADPSASIHSSSISNVTIPTPSVHSALPSAPVSTRALAPLENLLSQSYARKEKKKVVIRKSTSELPDKNKKIEKKQKGNPKDTPDSTPKPKNSSVITIKSFNVLEEAIKKLYSQMTISSKDTSSKKSNKTDLDSTFDTPSKSTPILSRLGEEQKENVKIYSDVSSKEKDVAVNHSLQFPTKNNTQESETNDGIEGRSPTLIEVSDVPNQQETK